MKRINKILVLILISICLIGCTNKEIIKTEKAPEAIGPYSQAVAYNEFIFCSGQIAIDPSTNEFIGGSIEEQTKRVFENVKAVLEESDSSLENILKCNVYLTDMNDFSKVNEIYATYFNEGNYPARSAVEVSKLPKGALIEIEVIAYKK